jgi:Chalcone isomerase-like
MASVAQFFDGEIMNFVTFFIRIADTSARRLCIFFLSFLGLAMPLTSLGAALDVSGVKFEETIDLRGNKLVLNGAGIRYKAVFKVYSAGLYLPKKVGTTEEVLAITGAKRISITMLRDIEANELGKLFIRGVEDNSPKAEMSKLMPSLLRMGQIFNDQKKLISGDTILMEWVPGSGSILSVKGKALGQPFTEPEFYNALLGIWLGQSPADPKLKEALLGKQN